MRPSVIIFSCRDFDGKVTPEEVAAAAMYLKDTLGKEGIQELISSLSKDKGILFVVFYKFSGLIIGIFAFFFQNRVYNFLSFPYFCYFS